MRGWIFPRQWLLKKSNDTEASTSTTTLNGTSRGCESHRAPSRRTRGPAAARDTRCGRSSAFTWGAPEAASARASSRPCARNTAWTSPGFLPFTPSCCSTTTTPARAVRRRRPPGRTSPWRERGRTIVERPTDISARWPRAFSLGHLAGDRRRRSSARANAAGSSRGRCWRTPIRACWTGSGEESSGDCSGRAR